MPLDIEKLTAPFDPDKVSWRVGSTNQDKTQGMALAYIDARDVMERLDSVVGPSGWQCEYHAVGSKTSCRIGIMGDPAPSSPFLAGEPDYTQWIWKADGAGDTDFEGDKGAFSDSFKRAAVKWGIGRYLYDLKAPWVAIEQKGRSYVIAKREMAMLQALLTGDKVKKAPPGVMVVRKWANEHIDYLNDSGDGETFLERLEEYKSHWVRAHKYADVWAGPENTGLVNDGKTAATVYGVLAEYDTFIQTVERLAAEASE